MNKDTQLSQAGAEIVEALTGFLDAVQEGGAVTDRFTVRTVDLNLKPRTYTSDDAKRTRELLGLSQALFARFIGVSVKTVRAWEQGTRELSGMANRFLDEVATNPEYWKTRIRDLMVTKDNAKPGRNRQSC